MDVVRSSLSSSLIPGLVVVHVIPRHRRVERVSLSVICLTQLPCHAPGAVGSTELPDLRRSGALENRAAWLQIVHGGALSDNGMASFAPSLSEDEVEAIRQYVIKRANEDKAMEAERAKTRVAAAS